MEDSSLPDNRMSWKFSHRWDCDLRAAPKKKRYFWPDIRILKVELFPAQFLGCYRKMPGGYTHFAFWACTVTWPGFTTGCQGGHTCCKSIVYCHPNEKRESRYWACRERCWHTALSHLLSQSTTSKVVLRLMNLTRFPEDRALPITASPGLVGTTGQLWSNLLPQPASVLNSDHLIQQ